MNKFKLFVTNFVFYGIGGVIGKIISFVMIPVIAKFLPDPKYFGLNDLSYSLVSFGSNIAIFGMYDAMFRMYFDDENIDFKKRVCSTSLVFVFFSTITICILILFFRKSLLFFVFKDEKYVVLLYISIISILIGSTNSIISAPTRMQNHKKTYLSLGLLSSLISYSISLPLILCGYYVIALPISTMLCAITNEIIFYFINKNWFSYKYFDFSLLKKMLHIAIPLVPNFLIYWIFNSSDIFMITNILNVKEAGIYSISNKFGRLSQLIYIAFAGGWQYFSFATMNDNNQVKTNSLIFEYLGVLAFAATACVCIFSSLIFKFLFPIEYYSGYIVAPYLFFSPLLQMLFQIIANQFLIIKKTLPSMLILLFGAIINVIFNLFLIPNFGIEGAAFATMLGYVTTVILCIFVLKKYKLVVLSKKFIYVTILFSFYLIFWRLYFSESPLFCLVIFLLFVIVIYIVWNNDIKLFLDNIEKNFISNNNE